MYYLFTFRSRANAMKFAENLRKEGKYSEVVSTPHSISGGCGLSVKVNDLGMGKKVLKMGKFSSFTGVYAVQDYNGTLNITKK